MHLGGMLTPVVRQHTAAIEKPLRARLRESKTFATAAPQQIGVAYVGDEREQRLHRRALAVARSSEHHVECRQRPSAHGAVAAPCFAARAARAVTALRRRSPR